MLRYLMIAVGVVALAVMLVMMNFTTPVEIGPIGVLFFFVAFYILMLSVIILALSFFYKISDKERGMYKRDYLMAGTLAFGPMLLLVVKALGMMNMMMAGLIFVGVGLSSMLVYKKA